MGRFQVTKLSLSKRNIFILIILGLIIFYLIPVDRSKNDIDDILSRALGYEVINYTHVQKTKSNRMDVVVGSINEIHIVWFTESDINKHRNAIVNKWRRFGYNANNNSTIWDSVIEYERRGYDANLIYNDSESFIKIEIDSYVLLNII
jgi:hypothetical protein